MVCTDIPTMLGHHSGLCHQTIASTGGWQHHTQPSHLGPQTTAAPMSLCLAPSHTGMACGTVVFALYDIPVLGEPGSWPQCWRGSTAIKQTWVFDGGVLGACRSQHCWEQSFGICFQQSQ